MRPDHHFLQPVFSAKGDWLFGELLSRFDGHDTKKIILAAEVIGSIVRIDLAALEASISLLAPTAVNLSPRTIETALMDVAHLIRPGLVVEITETNRGNIEHLREVAVEIHARGGVIALDDVGSGEFSDRVWLKQVIRTMRPSWLKLPITASDELIYWCRATGIPLVFKRIETPSDVARAMENRAAGLQGWFFDSLAGRTWILDRKTQDSQASSCVSSMGLLAA